MTGRTPHWLWRGLQAYVVLLATACAVGAVASYLFISARSGQSYVSVLQNSLDHGLSGIIVGWAPVLLLAVSVALGVVGVFLFRGRSWTLWAVAVAALVLVALLFFGLSFLHELEGNFYWKSKWVRLFKTVAAPAAALSVAAFVTAVADRTWLGR